MKKFLPVGRFRTVLSVIGACLAIGIILSFSEQVSSSNFKSLLNQGKVNVSHGDIGTMQKMIVTEGNVAMNLNTNQLNGGSVNVKSSGSTALRFQIEPDSFFKILVYNNELRGSLPSTMNLISQDTPILPLRLKNAYERLVVESTPPGSEYSLVVRDGQTGFVFFNIEGYQASYDGSSNSLLVDNGRMLISREFADELRRPDVAGTVAGDISINATMRAIEITNYVDGEPTSAELVKSESTENGTVPGPDVVVGDLTGLAQFGSSSGAYVGLAVGTDSCNFGTVDLDWFANPVNNHPVIPQNLYRMSGGATNDERFEQIGQSNVKHAFTALTNNICNLGCNGVGGTRLGSGCSDPYSASLNSGPSLGSRAWINPFTGAYPRNDAGEGNNSHTGHSHTGPSHRIMTEIADLNTSLNPGASYYAESQYVTPHEYVWCQSHPGQCNMNNNVSYRRYTVSGTASPFSFSTNGSTTQRMKSALTAWTGATVVQIQPDPANDGIGAIGYKVTNPSAGVWHYEYAIYNQNLDRVTIQSFGIPIGSGVNVTNVGFHAPPQQPGWAADGTEGNAGFSSEPWTQADSGGYYIWSSDNFSENSNANAVRWGTMYNIRFDSNRPPVLTFATVGFLKTGSPITVLVKAPSNADQTCSRFPTKRRC